MADIGKRVAVAKKQKRELWMSTGPVVPALPVTFVNLSFNFQLSRALFTEKKVGQQLKHVVTNISYIKQLKYCKTSLV